MCRQTRNVCLAFSEGLGLGTAMVYLWEDP